VKFAALDDAIAWAVAHPHMYDGLDVDVEGAYHVRTDASVLPPGVSAPEDVADATPRTPVHRLELPPHVARVEDLLIEAGWYPMSDFWRKTIARAYYFDTPEVIYRVGRRGGKSTTMCRVIVAETAFGEHSPSDGTVLTYMIVAQDRREAKKQIVTCRDILRAIGVAHAPKAETITLPALGREIAVYTASVRGVSGPTAIGALCDEVAKWTDDEGANPGAEVLRSLKPTMLTQHNAKLWLISSPWSVTDPHHDLFAASLTGAASTRPPFWAPTWVANPSETEERTHQLESHELYWRCEYYAVPVPSGDYTFFAADAIDEAQRLEVTHDDDAAVAAGADLAFRRNSSALVIGDVSERGIRVLYDREWVPGERSLRPGEVLTDMVAALHEHGCETVCADLHYVETLREHLDVVDVELVEFPTTSHGKHAAYRRAQALLAHGKIALAGASTRLIEQLRQTRMRPTSTGVQIDNPDVRGAHGDMVSAFVAAVLNLELPAGAGEAFGARRFAHDDAESLHDYAAPDDAVPPPDGAWWARGDGSRRFGR
jgi:hypothetical protein